MIIFEADVFNLALIKGEGNPPISANRNSPFLLTGVIFPVRKQAR